LPGEGGIGAQDAREDADAVVLNHAQDEYQELDGEDRGEVEMLVLVEQHGADAAFGARNAFDHGEHDPAHRSILAEVFDRLTGGAQDDHFPYNAPLAQAKTTRVVELLFRYFGYDGCHRRHEEDGHAEDEERDLQRVSAAEDQGE